MIIVNLSKFKYLSEIPWLFGACSTTSVEIEDASWSRSFCDWRSSVILWVAAAVSGSDSLGSIVKVALMWSAFWKMKYKTDEI